MSISTKSTRAVLRMAYEVGKERLSEYSHSSSPKKYSQPQLFACLVLKTYLKMDYRTTAVFFREFAEARDDIELRMPPHYTTLQKACQRLLKRRSDVVNLLEGTLQQFWLKKMGLRVF